MREQPSGEHLRGIGTNLRVKRSGIRGLDDELLLVVGRTAMVAARTADWKSGYFAQSVDTSSKQLQPVRYRRLCK